MKYTDVVTQINGKLYHISNELASFDLHESNLPHIEFYGVSDVLNQVYIKHTSGEGVIHLRPEGVTLYEIDLDSFNIGKSVDYFITAVSLTEFLKCYRTMQYNLTIKIGLWATEDRDDFVDHPAYDTLVQLEYIDEPTGERIG